MKKILDFILSFILPKKMIRYRNINFFLIILIFLGCMTLCAGASNLTLDNYVKRNKESFRLYEETFDLTSDEEVRLPKFTISETTATMDNFTIGEEADNIYEFSFDLENEKTLNLTLVYEPQVFVNDDEATDYDDRLVNFDINAYYNHEPKRTLDGELLEHDMLLIITREYIYYIFNHGKDLNKNENGEYTRYLESTGWNIMESKYVLPKDATEIAYTDSENKVLDYSKWTSDAYRGQTTEIGGVTFTANSTGEVAYFLPADQSEAVFNEYGDYDVTNWSMPAEKDEETIINGVTYKAQTKLNRNLHEVFVSDTSTRVGVFHLYQASNLGIEFGDLGDGKVKVNPVLVVEAIGNLMVSLGANQLQNYNLFYSLIFILLMPLLWTFATWVMSKKYGELTRFKEYYAICSVSFILPSLIIALFTLFVEPYAFIAQYAMFIQVAFYIFCIYKMNGINKNANANKSTGSDRKEPKEKVIDLEVETTPIQEKVSKTAQME